MNLFHALILGITEGLTEFLPVSSTAHLIIASKLLKIPQNDFLGLFEVFIQSGAILAVLFLYIRYIVSHKDILKKISLSFIPTAIVGFFFYKIIKSVFFESNNLIIGSIFLVGILFLFLEYLISNKKITLEHSIKKMSSWQAVMVGLVQALAVVPGVSRSGIIMLYMMWQGYKRDEAAMYSFILAVPTIFAAAGYDLFKMRDVISSSGDYFVLLCIGFFASFVVSYVVMKWFIGFLKKNSLVPFALYRVVLAIILMVFFI